MKSWSNVDAKTGRLQAREKPMHVSEEKALRTIDASKSIRKSFLKGE